MAKRDRDTYGGAGHNLPPEMMAAERAAKKLEAVAERTMAEAQQEHDRPRLMNTARRARLGSGVQEQQQAKIANAKTALQIAEALRDGRAGPLAKVSSLADVERLQSAYRSAMYANDAKRKEYRGSMTGVEPDRTDISHAKPSAFVRAYVSSSDVPKLKTLLKGKGVTRELARIEKIANRRDSWAHHDIKDIEAIEKVAKAIKKHVPNPRETWRKENWAARDAHRSANMWLGSLREFEAQKRLGLTDPKSLREMLTSYADARVNRAGADPIKAAERALIGVKMPGYFPTPESLAKRMADLADIRAGQTVLEPSAGSGRLADVARARGASVDTVEMQSRLRDLLTKKGHNLIDSDFTEMKPEAKYDRILMNPPFEKRADAEHVRRAYEHLKPGGKMVAIMGEGVFFGSDKKATEFRNWLDAAGGTSEKLPEGTFKESNTGVNTRLVVIDKPGSAPTASNVQAAMKVAPSNERPASNIVGASGMQDAYERNGQVYGKVLGEPTIYRPGSDGDPFKYKSSFHVDGPLDKDGYPVEARKIHAATLEDFERQVREHKSKNPGWQDPARAASAAARGIGDNAPKGVVQDIHPAADKKFTSISLKIGDQEWSTAFRNEHPEGMLKHNIGSLRETYRKELARRFNEAVARGDTLDLKGVKLKTFGGKGGQDLGQVTLKPDHAGALDGSRETVKGSGKRAWTAKAYTPDKISFFGEHMPLASKQAGIVAKALGMPAFGDVVSQIESAVKSVPNKGWSDAAREASAEVRTANAKPKDPGIQSAVERAIARSEAEAAKKAKAGPQLLPAPVDAPAPSKPAPEVRKSGKRFEVLDNGQPILDSKGKPKWFGSQEKAEKFLSGRVGKAFNKLGAVSMIAAPVTAAVLAYDAKKSEAQAAGASSSSATGSAVAAGAVAGTATAAVGYGIAKGMTWAVRGAVAAGAAAGAPVIGTAAIVGVTALGVGMMAKGAYDGYQKHGVKGAVLGSVGAEGLLDRKPAQPAPASPAAPVRLSDSQKTQFATANATYNAMQKAPAADVGVSTGGRGFANLTVQRAAQQARGRTYDPSRKIAANG